MQIVEPCQFLSWDTDFFGHRIARVVGHRLNPQRVEAILEWSENHHIECLYFLADPGDPNTVRLGEDYGFRLVDIRVTFQCGIRNRLTRPRDDRSGAVRIRPSCSEDVPILQAIARTSHGGSRFYFDPCFPAESCDALYETWIERSCGGYADVVLVAEAQGQPVGYVSCHLSDSEPYGRIGLVGVGPDARGRGVGRMLVSHALDWFAEHGVEEVSVVTQGRNVEAQRLYQRCGFLAHFVQLWYHRWMLDCASGGGL